MAAASYTRDSPATDQWRDPTLRHDYNGRGLHTNKPLVALGGRGE